MTTKNIHVDGIIFDLDGTLTDYKCSSEKGLQFAFNVLRVENETIDFDVFKKTYHEVVPIETKVRRNTPENR